MANYALVEAKNDQGTIYFYVGEMVEGTAFSGYHKGSDVSIMAPTHWRAEPLSDEWKPFGMGVIVFDHDDILDITDLKKNEGTKLPPGYSY